MDNHLIQESDLLARINAATKLTIGQEFFAAIGEIIHDVTKSDYTYITKIDSAKGMAKPIISIGHGESIENVTYNLRGTPCLQVSKTCVGYYPSDVQELFPEDHYLKKLSIESYLGASIVIKNEEFPFAIITCLYEKTPENSMNYLSMIQFIAQLIEDRVQREYLVRENYELKKNAEKHARIIDHNQLLLKEIHHRVKNNLQIVASLLNLQKSKASDEETRGLIEVCRNRVQSMALVHEMLYSSQDLQHVDIQDYIKKITDNTLNKDVNPKLELTVDVSPELIDLDMLIPCGLILCEAMSNFQKYVYDKDPRLKISFIREGNVRTLKVRDYGNGFPENVLAGDYSGSLGMDLINSLSEQINGKVNCYNDSGAIIEIEFPVL